MTLFGEKLNINSIKNVLVYIFIALFFIINIIQSYVFGILIVLVIFTTKYKEIDFKKLFYKKLNILIVLFFIIKVSSNVFSNGGFGNIEVLESKVSLLFFPFLVPLLMHSIKTYFIIISSLVGIVLMYVINFYFLYFTEMETLNETIRMGVNFLHPSYISIIVCFLLHLFVYEYFISQKRISLIIKILAPLLFVSVILISNSKIGYLGFLFVLVLNLFLYVRKFKAYFVLFLVLIGILVMGFITIKTTTILERFEESYQEIFYPNPDPNYVMSTGERIVAWKTCKSIIKDNFWLGVGVGNEKEIMVKYYTQTGHITNADLKLDAHQQFLQTFMATGILGFIVLILIFILPMIKSIKKKDVILFGFMILFLIFGLTESMLERQSGIVFFIFFVLFFSSKMDSDEKVLHLSK